MMRTPAIVLTAFLALAGCAAQADRPSDGRPLATRLAAEEEPQFLKDYARLLARSGRLAEAARVLEALRQRRPDDGETLRLLAGIYEQEGHLELALLAWQAVRAHSMDAPADSGEYARVALRLRRFDAAEAVFRSWLERAAPDSPEQAMALNNLAYCHLLRGEAAEARELLARALAIDPLHPRARANLRVAEKMTEE